MAGDSLHQLRVQYVAEHDRLMLRIATVQRQEFRIWLTRRLVKRLWPHLVGALAQQIPPTAASEPAKEAVMAFQHEQAAQAADFKSDYQEEGLTPALGPEPMLPVKLNCQPRQEGGATLVFDDESGRRVPLNLGAALLHNVIRLIADVAGRAEWDLALERPSAAPAGVPDKGGAVH